MDLEVLGVDHVYVTVSDVVRSEQFYDPVMAALGFKKGVRPIAGERHAHYFNRVMQYTLRPARDPSGPADAYATGALHHLCFRVHDRRAVDAAQRALTALGVVASPPRLYPEYRPDYYATFFEDPDGIRLEVVSDTRARELIRERWHELRDFVDPVRKLLEREPSATPGVASPLARSLYDGAEPPDAGEAFTEVALLGGTKIERIVSSQQPGSEPYDQAHDEWVVLLRGRARLEIAGELLQLSAGDHVLLPAGTPHRVLETSHGALWLAVHVERAPATQGGRD
jgi:catechol 2,3-dioxygenase-like lactoylglutathione lyase family enzyme/quercetin dioxygenase-like cupin family protein